MLFSPHCHGTCFIWRSLIRSFLNIRVSLEDGLFASCLMSDSAQFPTHYYQLLGIRYNTSKHKRLFSVITMEFEADDNHPNSSPQRKHMESPHKLSLTEDLQKKATENMKIIYLPPSLQCKGDSERKIVTLTNQMPLQEPDDGTLTNQVPFQDPDKKSTGDGSSVKQLPPSLLYKSVSGDDFLIKDSFVPQQERTDVCDFKENDFCTSVDSGFACTQGNESKDTSNHQPLHDPKENMANKNRLPPSLLHFVENFVRDNIKLVTDQVKKESYEDFHEGKFQEGSINRPCSESEDTETPFSNMNLFSSSESTERSATAQKKKSRKCLKKLSKKKILIALAVALLAFIISSLSRSKWFKEEMVAKSKKEGKSFSVQSESDGTPDGKGKKMQPNYFIAIQVNNTEITRAAVKIQSGIQEASGQDLSQLKIAPETLHITLMVMYLSNQEEIDRASQCLIKCVPAIKETHRDLPMTLEFEGLSGFSGGRVIFASVKDPGQEILQSMSDEVKKQMKDCGIENSDPENKPFRPHLTLMKYRWKSKYKSTKDPKKVEDSWYQAFASEYLGSQIINSLQLCKMQEKRDDGYYFVDQEVPF